jgi:MarR family 2-MHQ and catechol resistance regulon transcriptional repressor
MGTRHRGAAEEVRALDAYIKLLRSVSSVTARVHRHLAKAALTIGQFAVLEAVFHLGPLYQRDLCDKLLMSGGNVTMVADHLERRGLVKRTRCPENRRLVEVTLTPAGRRLIAKVFPVHARAVARTFSVLTPAEQEDLARLCRKLGLGAAAGPPA